MVLALPAPAWGGLRTSGKRRAWTPPLYGVPRSGRHGDRTQSNGSLFFVRPLREPLRQHQRLDRRIPDEATLTRAIVAWEHQRNTGQTTIDWRFSVSDARKKLKWLSPSLAS